MDQNIISFPGLGIGEFTVNEVALSLFDGKLTIRWYAIFICLGIVLAYIYFMSRGTKKEGIKEDSLINLVLFLVPIAVIGARLLYVLTDKVKQDTFMEVIAIWEGGLAIYGALIFGTITAIVFCLITKINVLKLLDALAPAVLIGQIIGRWGNFINGEAFGDSANVGNLPWRMVVNGAVTHPTFLYESIWNLLGFIIINIVYKKKKFNGQIFCLYISWYGIGRAFIEVLRTDSLMIGEDIKLMVVLGIACFIGGIALYVFLLLRSKKADRELEEYERARILKEAMTETESTRDSEANTTEEAGEEEYGDNN